MEIKLEKQMRGAFDAFESATLARVAVMACYPMTGDADYLLRVLVSDMQSMEQSIVDYLAKIPAVSNIRPRFASTRVNHKTALPLPENKRAGAIQIDVETGLQPPIWKFGVRRLAAAVVAWRMPETTAGASSRTPNSTCPFDTLPHQFESHPMRAAGRYRVSRADRAK
jgi:hypothetical protein